MSTDTPGNSTDSDLGRMLTVEIKMAVRRAVTDQAIKEVLRKEVADQVTRTVLADLEKQMGSRIAKEVSQTIWKEVSQIEDRVVAKVRRDLLESWTLATTALREELGKGGGTASDTSLKSLMQPGLVSSEAPRASASDTTGPSVKSRKAGWLLPRMLVSDKAIVVVLLLFLALSISVIGLILIPGPRSPERSAVEPVPSPMPTTPSPSTELSIAAQRIRDDGMRVVSAAEGQLPFGTSLRDLFGSISFDEQFTCWFPDDTQKELEKLARSSSVNDIQRDLEDAFGPCFAKEPRLRDPTLAIFSAQATVAHVFSKYRTEWDSWCAIAAEMSPSSNLIADGHMGPATQDSMNLFLHCTGHSSELTIEKYSTSPQYLYVTYLALRELQR